MVLCSVPCFTYSRRMALCCIPSWAVSCLRSRTFDPKNAEQVSDEIRGELIHLLELINREEPNKIQAAGLGTFLPSA